MAYLYEHLKFLLMQVPCNPGSGGAMLPCRRSTRISKALPNVSVKSSPKEKADCSILIPCVIRVLLCKYAVTRYRLRMRVGGVFFLE